jgi:hypothetical protein
MTGTEEALFDSAGSDALRLHIADSALGDAGAMR